MPTEASRLQKQPCAYCRESHLKCDNQRPKCGQCQTRGRDCVRTLKQIVFRHWKTENPAISPTRDRGPGRGRRNTRKKQARPASRPSEPTTFETSPLSNLQESYLSPNPSLTPSECHEESYNEAHVASNTHYHGSQSYPSTTSPLATSNGSSPNNDVIPHLGTCDEKSCSPDTLETVNSGGGSEIISNQVLQRTWPHGHISKVLPSDSIPTELNNTDFKPIDYDLEACLLRYFTEELAHWFDLCDPSRHFQLCVSQRARTCEPLRNAIYAAASRHLARQPQYRTSDGIRYYGKLLCDLTDYTAVEYMLQCIPALSSFYHAQSDWHQEDIMAAAVILRQCEEMDESGIEDVHELSRVTQSANFLSITITLVEHAMSISVRSSLTDAIIWMALRQEIYYCIMQERPPRMHFQSEMTSEVSTANQLVIFAGSVADWRWGAKSPQQWEGLVLLQRQLRLLSLRQFIPILEKEADKSVGEIFPTIWYGSDAETTAVQYFEFAGAMLIAEDPQFDKATPKTRIAQRRAEAQVRSIILKLCGIALGRPKSPPSFIIAVAAIMHYGEYFTDRREQEALIDVVQRTKNMHAESWWTSSEALREKWGMPPAATITHLG